MGHITQNIAPQRGRISSLITHMYRHTHMHTHSTAAADVQQWESATYFFVVFLACWLRILAVVISRRPAAGIRLSVVKFILLIGPWPRRAQRAGLRLLNTTLDLHLPLQCLEKEEQDGGELSGKRDELDTDLHLFSWLLVSNEQRRKCWLNFHWMI